MITANNLRLSQTFYTEVKMKKYQLQEIDNPVLESIQSACLESGDIGRAIILAYAQGYAEGKKHREECKADEKKEDIK